MKRYICAWIFGIFLTSFLAGGCAQIGYRLAKYGSPSGPQIKWSKTIQIEPLSPAQRILWINTRNTTGDKAADISALAKMFEERGFKLVDDPDQATVRIQANSLYVGKTTPAETQQIMMGGFNEGTLIGGAIGGGIGTSTDSTTGILVGAGLGAAVGSAVGGVLTALTEPVTYSVFADIRVSQKRAKVSKTRVSESTSSRFPEGAQAESTQRVYVEESDWRNYDARIVASETQIGLTKETALSDLLPMLLNALAGIL